MKPRFRIGDYVNIKARIQTAYVYRGETRDCHKVLQRLELWPPVSGWIVGAARRFEGVINPGWSDHDGEYTPADLGVTGSKLLWKVARSMTNTPLEAADEDVALVASSGLTYLPCPLQLGTPWATAGWSPEDQRKEMKAWPRDKKGRWLKKEH